MEEGAEMTDINIPINYESVKEITKQFVDESNKEFDYDGKIIFRPHRGGTVFTALKEAKEFDTVQEMKKHVVELYDGCFSVEDIVIINDPVNDSRIGWRDARYVCTKKFLNEDYIEKYGVPQCIGFCATDYEVQ